MELQQSENIIRSRILHLCVSPKRMIDIERALDIPRGTLRHHLNKLQEENLIMPMKREDEGKGRPTFIQTNIENYRKLEQEKIKAHEERRKQFLSDPRTVSLLNELSKGSLTDIEINNLNDNLVDSAYITMQIIPFLTKNGMISNTYNLTEKGKKYLEEHSHPSK